MKIFFVNTETMQPLERAHIKGRNTDHVGIQFEIAQNSCSFTFITSILTPRDEVYIDLFLI